MTFSTRQLFGDAETEKLFMARGVAADEFFDQAANAVVAQTADDDALFGGKLSERGVDLSELKRDYGALTSLHASLGKLSKGARREHRSGGEALTRATRGGVAC
jgi:hypothetical protein